MSSHHARYERPHFRSRECNLTPLDQDELCALLREHYPTTIFCNIDRREPDQLIYYSSISECDDSCSIWIPEPGWKPEWGYESEEMRALGQTVLLNLPRPGLFYHQSPVVRFKVSDWYSDLDLPDRLMNAEFLKFGRQQGLIQGYFFDDEPEAKAFLTWFFNATRRMWTSRFQIIDLVTGRVIDETSGGTEWCGPDAVRRCTEEADFFTTIWNSEEYGTLVGAKALPKKQRARKRPDAGKSAAKK